MKFSELQPDQRKATADYIDSRCEQLNGLAKESVEAGLNHAFLANAGGAAAVLGFVGAYHEAAAKPGSIAALGIFLVGIVLTILTHALRYHFFSHLFDKWKRDALAFYRDDIQEQALIDNDDARVADKRVNLAMHLLGYGALGAFSIGCLTGICSFMP